jgi:hypothetical protein
MNFLKRLWRQFLIQLNINPDRYNRKRGRFLDRNAFSAVSKRKTDQAISDWGKDWKV